jgi:hypothetical protein
MKYKHRVQCKHSSPWVHSARGGVLDAGCAGFPGSKLSCDQRVSCGACTYPSYAVLPLYMAVHGHHKQSCMHGTTQAGSGKITLPLMFTSESLATQTATCVINMLMEGASRAAPMSVSPTYVTRSSSAVQPACSDTTAHSC